jgi:hypothetical protein
MTPLHICEVTIRNAVSETLEGMFGARWPWSAGLIQSLPAPAYGYNPRQDLVVTRRRHPTTGKVIPELKFVFWQKMFTGRYDFRLWNAHIGTAFPNTDPAHATSQIRAFLYDELDHIRTLRNRIAHHEPIFTRDLQSDLERIEKLINLRCSMTATWMMNNQQASAIIAARP